MKTLDKGQDKIQEICDALRKETLEPAQGEAERIIEEAKQRAHTIVQEAHSEAKTLHEDARATIEKEKNVFESSLSQAVKQSLEVLRQEVETHLFNSQLQETLKGITTDPKVIARLIEAMVKGVEKEGIAADLGAIIPETVPVEEVAGFLAEEVVKKLEKGGVILGPITGGAQVKLTDKKITLDMTDESFRKLLANYVRKDFRTLFFAE